MARRSRQHHPRSPRPAAPPTPRRVRIGGNVGTLQAVDADGVATIRFDHPGGLTTLGHHPASLLEVVK